MADIYNLANLVVINDQRVVDQGSSDLLNDAPLLQRIAADVASNGTTHRFLVEDGAPAVGFRAVNTGRDHSKSSDRTVVEDLKILDASGRVDKALADAYRFGPEAFLAREMGRHLREAMFKFESQIINGTASEADGFNGLKDELDSSHDAFVDAGHTSASADGTSVYMIRSTMDLADVVAIAGRDGIVEMGDIWTQMVEDGDGKKFPAYAWAMQMWGALQVGGKWSVVRIGNINGTADGTDNTVTDDLLALGLERFPSARQPSLIAMNRRALRQLQQSRTATNATGAPAPRPTEYEGFPIVVVDSITNEETVPAP